MGSSNPASGIGSGISDFASDIGSGIGDFASDVSDVFSLGPDYAKGAEIDDYALEAETKAFEKLGDVPTDPAAKEKYYEDFEKMLLEGLKTSANMRISGFQGPRIRGLFG